MPPREGTIRHIWIFSYPLIVSHASYTVMQFMGRLFLSWYGPNELAAAIPSGVLSFLLISFFMGVASYTNVFIAQYHGRNDQKNLTVSLWQGVIWSLLAGVLIIIMIPLGLFILKSSRHDEAVRHLEASYFVLAAPGGVFAVLNNALSGFFTGRGKTKVTMVASLAGNLVNIILSYLLIFGAGPIPSLGIRGAAVGLVSGNMIITMIYFSLILSKKNRDEFSTLHLMRFHRPLFKRMLRFGLPNGISFFLDIASFSAFIFLIGNIGRTALAANNIVLSLETVAFMPILGISIATSTLVGQMIGRQKKELAVRSTYSALILNLIYTGTLAILFSVFPDFFIRFFSMRDPAGYAEIAVQARSLMRILSFFVVIDAVNVTFSSAIKGAGDTRFQMIVSTVCAWAFFVPGVYIFCNLLHYPIETAWILATLYLTLLAVTFLFRFRSNRWQAIKMISEEPVLPPPIA